MSNNFLLQDILKWVAHLKLENANRKFRLLNLDEAEMISQKIATIFCENIESRQFWWENLKFPFIGYDLEHFQYDDVIRSVFADGEDCFLVFDSHRSDPYVISATLLDAIDLLGEISFVDEYAVVSKDYLKMINVNHDNVAYAIRIDSKKLRRIKN